MTVRPLAEQEAALNGGFTHVATISANDLTMTTANTVQTISICALKAGDVTAKILWRIKTYFTDASDAAFNVTTISFGNTLTSTTAHIAAIEVNSNGTEVRSGFTNTAVGPYVSADSITITFTSMAAKSLSDIDAGELEVLFQIIRPAAIEEAILATAIT